MTMSLRQGERRSSVVRRNGLICIVTREKLIFWELLALPATMSCVALYLELLPSYRAHCTYVGFVV